MRLIRSVPESLARHLQLRGVRLSLKKVGDALAITRDCGQRLVEFMRE